MQQAREICEVIGAGDPTDIMFAAREGMSLDELVRKLAREEVAAIKRRSEEETNSLSARVAQYLNRADIKGVIDRENLSYFRHPNNSTGSKRASGAAHGRKFHVV
jgi:hypothetical protein